MVGGMQVRGGRGQERGGRKQERGGRGYDRDGMEHACRWEGAGRGWEGRGARGDRRGGQDLIRKFLGLLLGGGSGATLTAKGVLVRGIFKKSSTKLEVYGDKFPHIYQGILNMGTKLQASILNI